MQHAARRDGVQQELYEAKDQLARKSSELKNLVLTVESLRSANEELKRAFAVTAAASEGGKNLAESAKEMERIRKTMTSQLADFDTMKKSLMRDLQDRCEKVVELEISLDEMKEQYQNVLRNTNSKAQQRKMQFLERNLDQLAGIQRQLVEQNTTLKREAGLAEKRLLARNDRIINLESMLIEAQDKLNSSQARYDAQFNTLKREMTEMRQANARAGPQLMTSAMGIGSKISKPLRGGGGSVAESNSPNPKSLEAKRTSWFFGTGS
jgi:kinesin family protein 5